MVIFLFEGLFSKEGLSSPANTLDVLHCILAVSDFDPRSHADKALQLSDPTQNRRCKESLHDLPIASVLCVL
jgi:hypothetical protein